MPGVMGGFGKFSAEVLKDSALSTKTKELKKSTGEKYRSPVLFHCFFSFLSKYTIITKNKSKTLLVELISTEN